MKYNDPANLRRALDILDGMVRKMERGGRIEIADAAAVLGFLGIVAGDEPLVAGLEDTLKTKRGKEFVRSSRRLSQILRGCLNSEDNAADNELGKSSAELELQAGLARLERKYAFPELLRSSKSASYV